MTKRPWTRFCLCPLAGRPGRYCDARGSRSSFAAMRIPTSVAAATLSALIAASSLAHAQRPLKVYISADMEGITDVASVDQLAPANFEYAQARQWMTADVLAAIQGAREAGATEFVVSDSHGNGQS